jgi:oligoendopeptidase F
MEFKPNHLAVFGYFGVTDPQIQKDIDFIIELMKQFQSKHSGNLHSSLEQAFLDLEKITCWESKVIRFLQLSFEYDTTNGKIRELFEGVHAQLTNAEKIHLNFFERELAQCSSITVLQQIQKSNVLPKYRQYINFLTSSTHYLLAPEEEIERQSQFLSGYPELCDAWATMIRKVRVLFMGKKYSIPGAIEKLQQEPDKMLAYELHELINTSLGGLIASTTASTLYEVAAAGYREARDRKAENPMVFRFANSGISLKSIDRLHKLSVQPLLERFYTLKADYMGVRKLQWAYRMATVTREAQTSISVEEACDIVRDVLQSFSPILAETFADIVKNGWLDFEPREGKQQGTYTASFMMPGNIPVSIISFTYKGSWNDVLKLAHEAGHAVEAVLSGRKNGHVLQKSPQALSEIPSIFFEMLAFRYISDRLTKAGKTQELLELTINKISRMLNMTVHSVVWSNFERRAYGLSDDYGCWGKPKPKSASGYSRVFQEEVKKMYGDIFVYANMPNDWVYAPEMYSWHKNPVQFPYAPGFVRIAYAIGELLAQAIYAQKTKQGSDFESMFVTMISSGGTADAGTLLGVAGIDLQRPNFWQSAFEEAVTPLIEQTEALMKKIQQRKEKN